MESVKGTACFWAYMRGHSDSNGQHEAKVVQLTVHGNTRLIVIFLRLRSRAPLVSTVRLLLLQDAAALTAQDTP